MKRWLDRTISMLTTIENGANPLGHQPRNSVHHKIHTTCNSTHKHSYQSQTPIYAMKITYHTLYIYMNVGKKITYNASRSIQSNIFWISNRIFYFVFIIYAKYQSSFRVFSFCLCVQQELIKMKRGRRVWIGNTLIETESIDTPGHDAMYNAWDTDKRFNFTNIYQSS